MNKFDYCEVVCNFLNNTQGYIETYQTKFLLLELFDLDIEDFELEKYISFDLGYKLNSSVETDDNVSLYEDLHTLYTNIKNNKKCEEFEDE